MLSGALADYARLKQRLGLSRTVVVQPTAYGTDNSCTLEAMARLGEARGVAIVAPEETDAGIARLNTLGMRGVRYHMLPGGGVTWDSLAVMASRVAKLGWHVQLQLEGHEIGERASLLARLPCDVVIDHVGRFRGPVAKNDANGAALRRLVDAGHCWVKLSAPYHGSRNGPPDYEDIGVLARELIVAAPERMLWASNWPHPSLKNNFPDDAELLGLLAQWAPDEATRRRILVANPAQLYGF